jgi:hypothetical protein
MGCAEEQDGPAEFGVWIVITYFKAAMLVVEIVAVR